MWLALAACSRGAVDGIESIAQGYYLADAGGNGRTIEYHGDGQKPITVIAARVESYSRKGAIIVVSRRPASVIRKGGNAEWYVSPTCEYWIIETTNHTVRLTTDEQEYSVVRCAY